ncbi:MAG: hypothetical protein NZL87_05010 [Thermomicrobium sp.]|nr:hypothetical protein [Thermomicrobium sp.]
MEQHVCNEPLGGGAEARPPRERLRELFETPDGRRWLRAAVLPQLPRPEAEQLAAQLLAFREDFSPQRRDWTTRSVVEAADRATLDRQLTWLAASNAALALWERLANEGLCGLVSAALRVLRRSSPLARELVLTLFVADPTREVRLPRSAERALLVVALVDADDAVRGLAAEAAWRRAPELLLAGWRQWVRDPSGRVRRAAWQVALRRRADARGAALALVTDEGEPVAVRADALWALGQCLPTAELAPVLAAAIQDPALELAAVAADLLWWQHRHPLPAQAARRSPHPAVRALGAALLDPHRGSPAAGGARSGLLPLL